ncbi:MAG: SUMF1/EgtB/PvdO family nonheme iron enzyme [Myxococcota bacterium]|nr:SUMF1/EgtB/PvdO family nonheme iron enzyme [Myxococcota bacterium]
MTLSRTKTPQSFILSPLLVLFFLGLAYGKSEARGRLVILELTGAAPIETLQSWSDQLRALALERKPEHAKLISRAQIAVLIPPEELAECSELCEVELAQKMNADWVISGTLSERANDARALTLKLHRATGELVAIERGLYQDAQSLSAALPLLGRRLLEKVWPTREESSAPQQAKEAPPPPQEEAPSVTSTATAGYAPRQISAGDFSIAGRRYLIQSDFCLTRPVSFAEYARCVRADACEALEEESPPCAGAPTDPVRCVTHEQARLYASWRGGRLPIEAELRRAEQHCGVPCKALASPPKLREWLQSFEGEARPAAYPSIGGNSLTGARALTLNFRPGRDPAEPIFDDWTPQNFQSADLGFRVRLPSASAGCQPLSAP